MTENEVRIGLIHLLTGDQVLVFLTTKEHGQFTQGLLTIERPANPAPPTASEPDDGQMRAVVNSLTTSVAMVL